MPHFGMLMMSDAVGAQKRSAPSGRPTFIPSRRYACLTGISLPAQSCLAQELIWAFAIELY